LLEDAQSPSTTHEVLHAVAPQMKGVHAVVTPPVQDPAPLQVSAVVWLPPEHEAAAPHAVPLAGKTHAPPELQSVAPQAPPTGLHAAAQQWPEPRAPHTPLTH
jgi:hypothetical protein